MSQRFQVEPLLDVQVNANTQQQEKLQEKNEASTYQMEQQMRQSPGSVTQQQINNKVRTAHCSLFGFDIGLLKCSILWPVTRATRNQDYDEQQDLSSSPGRSGQAMESSCSKRLNM